MSSIVFLLVFVVLTLVGAFLLWLRERGPRSMEAHIREFERQRQALAPDSLPRVRRGATRSPERDHWGG